MNQIVIDLSGLDSEEQVLSKLGETFEFGGPNGNYSVSPSKEGGWGMNWDALNDSLSYLDTGGIWGTSKIFEFPLKVVFENSEVFGKHDKRYFQNLNEILADKVKEYEKAKKKFEFEFK